MKKPYSKYMDDRIVKILEKGIKNGEVQETIAMIDALILHYTENGLDIDEENESEDDEGDNSISISYGNKSKVQNKNQSANSSKEKMLKFDSTKVYIMESIIQESSLFKKEIMDRHKCYARLVHNRGNANPATHVQFTGTDGRGGTGDLDLSTFKFNTWHKAIYEGAVKRWRIVES
jgi:hypothetical protein